jgi:hypothetical protein
LYSFVFGESANALRAPDPPKRKAGCTGPRLLHLELFQA